MADSYRVGPKPPKAKTKRQEDERKELYRRVDRINEGKDPYKGPRVVEKSGEEYLAESDRKKAINNRVADARQYDDSSTQGMDSIKGKLKIQKAKAGASNPPHNFKKY